MNTKPCPDAFAKDYLKQYERISLYKTLVKVPAPTTSTANQERHMTAG